MNKPTVHDMLACIEDIRQVASGEKQVAPTDTEALEWIANRIAALNPTTEEQ